MSKNYSEQELKNVISDNIKYIADGKEIADVTAEDVKDYFAVNAENQDVDAETIAEDAKNSISHYAHEIENDDAEIESILADIKDRQ